MRVLMLMPGPSWEENWARAAASVADVVRLRPFRGGREGRWLERVEGTDVEYRLRELRPKVPYKVFGPAADVPGARRALRAIAEIEARHGRVDVIHAHFSDGSRWLPFLERRGGYPYVVTEHSTAWTLDNPDKQISARGLRVAAGVYEHAACVIPVSESLRRSIEGFGVHGPFHVVPNPVDTDLFSPLAGALPASPLRLVTVSRLELVKRVDLVIEAAARIAASGTKVALTIVGDGSVRQELEDFARVRLGNGCVRFSGWCVDAEIAAELRASHLFVSASRAENLPVSVIEAMACGLPVVATRVGGVPELFGPHAPGRLVDRDDVDALTEAIGDLARQLPTEEQRSLAAAEVAARFSFERVGHQLGEIYATAVRSNRRAKERA